MKIYLFDSDFTLKEQIGTPDLHQYEDNATLIFCHVDGIDESNFAEYLAQFTATPAGALAPLADIITDFAEYTINGVTYKGWRYFVSSKFTQIAGLLMANLVLSKNGVTKVSQAVTLNVNASSNGAKWNEGITQAQWYQLLQHDIGLRNPILGAVDLSEPNILDDYNTELSAGAYYFTEAGSGNLCLLNVGYDEENEAVKQTLLTVRGSALFASTRTYDDGEWGDWASATGSGSVSVQARRFQKIPTTSNNVQSALEAIDELLPNNFILATDFHTNLAGEDTEDAGYTFTDLGNEDYEIGFPEGENIYDFIYRMCGVHRIATPEVAKFQVIIVTTNGNWYSLYKRESAFIIEWFATWAMKMDVTGLEISLSNSVQTKSLLVKNSSITNFRADSSKVLANIGGNYMDITSSKVKFADNGNEYEFPYPSGTAQTAYEKKLATVGMINDLLDLADGRYATGLVTSLDSDYKLTISLEDHNGNTISTQVVDLPCEMAFVNASFDEDTKDLTFTLQNGDEVVVPLNDIITGLATESYVTSAISTATTGMATQSWVGTQLASYSTTTQMNSAIATSSNAVASMAKRNLGGILRHMLADKNSLNFSDTDSVDLGDLTWGNVFNPNNWADGYIYYARSDAFAANNGNKLGAEFEMIPPGDAWENLHPYQMTGTDYIVICLPEHYTTVEEIAAAVKGMLVAYEKL